MQENKKIIWVHLKNKQETKGGKKKHIREIGGEENQLALAEEGE